MNQLFNVPVKECSCCGLTKPISEFYRESYTDKISNQCKVCVNTKRRVQRDKAKHSKFVSKEKQRDMVDELDYALVDWRDAMIHFGGSCAFCGKPEGRAKADKLDRDHVVALSRGGKTERKNIIPACRKCNRGRGNKDWKQWFEEQDFYTVERCKRIRAWVEQ